MCLIFTLNFTLIHCLTVAIPAQMALANENFRLVFLFFLVKIQTVSRSVTEKALIYKMRLLLKGLLSPELTSGGSTLGRRNTGL